MRRFVASCASRTTLDSLGARSMARTAGRLGCLSTRTAPSRGGHARLVTHRLRHQPLQAAQPPRQWGYRGGQGGAAQLAPLLFSAPRCQQSHLLQVLPQLRLVRLAEAHHLAKGRCAWWSRPAAGPEVRPLRRSPRCREVAPAPQSPHRQASSLFRRSPRHRRHPCPSPWQLLRRLRWLRLRHLRRHQRFQGRLGCRRRRRGWCTRGATRDLAALTLLPRAGSQPSPCCSSKQSSKFGRQRRRGDWRCSETSTAALWRLHSRAWGARSS